ncbi:uncharacterized protein LOC115588649 [Sparus aurata]|uniref:uncharacterized protein LOC115588649 n=1 Tax=Sparus aurata TaxID=8175 RepID=UPI0011C1C1AF|nr:uncharacterized protein LOC115588649 [Sparus aurata]XP_030285230.1 uncharacterized protein LOC115588649 [Sparus aurata]XP_030285231.1 uncharacterized protein LOC115588649 [Sparus aurata]XP_030285232.1 uncharacterized protein LOC115588649 [Sparus aurata]XP_030285234.1 uncharacterized protein LOC115588649 [Sparus aurata]XP_030285235.1 uncharacterized protein LOC115588649 [Sparus aurata]XP_030285236.1 uncharacterized protein LOC115588649 [Sparus aurata]
MSISGWRASTTGSKLRQAINAIAEMGEMPLEIRRHKLGLRYLMKLKGQNEMIPTKNLLNEHWEFMGISKKAKTNFAEKLKSVVREIGMVDISVCPPVCRPVVPAWLIPDPMVDLKLLNKSKTRMSEDVVKEVKIWQQLKWGDHLQIYTDGSKDHESGRVAVGISIPEIGYKKGYRISDHMSVFTAEMVAVLWALRWIEENKQGNSIICSDSAATLTTIKETKSKYRPDVVVEILQSLFRIHKAGYEVGFLWVPAHMGVKGNEEADEMAKKAVKEERVQIHLQYGAPEYTERINRFLKEKWQKSWEKERKGRAYFIVQQSVSKSKCTIKCNRKDSVLLS